MAGRTRRRVAPSQSTRSRVRGNAAEPRTSRRESLHLDRALPTAGVAYAPPGRLICSLWASDNVFSSSRIFSSTQPRAPPRGPSSPSTFNTPVHPGPLSLVGIGARGVRTSNLNPARGVRWAERPAARLGSSTLPSKAPSARRAADRSGSAAARHHSSENVSGGRRSLR